MVFNIQDIKSNINKHGGLARTNKFVVIIPTAQVGVLGVQDLSLFCESAQLPGLNFQTNEFRQNGYGMVEKRPYMVAVTDAQMTFFADADSDVVKHFHQWIKSVNSFNNEVGEGKDTFAYPDDYVVDIDIEVYRIDETIAQTYKLIRAYPLTIGDVQMAWGEKNNIIKFPVTFSFHTWSTNELNS